MSGSCGGEWKDFAEAVCFCEQDGVEQKPQLKEGSPLTRNAYWFLVESKGI